MQNYLDKDEVILTSKTDARGQLTVAGLFDLFMDLAAEQAEYMNVGYRAMLDHRAFWVAVRTRIHIYQLPGLLDTVRARTWPGTPKLVKCDRFYRLSMGERVLAEGRTEWVAQNIDTGRVLKVDAYEYPVDMEPVPERVCDGPFTRFRETVAPENLLTTYTVGSRDIDTGRHMNNVAYIRMIMGTFSVAELEVMEIDEVEVADSVACREGETLSIYRRKDDEGWHFLVCKPDGSAAMQAVLRLRS